MDSARCARPIRKSEALLLEKESETVVVSTTLRSRIQFQWHQTSLNDSMYCSRAKLLSAWLPAAPRASAKVRTYTQRMAHRSSHNF
jgi:hypothetical protein